METLKHSERPHALLSASKAERWLNCPPSARLEEKFPEQTPTTYAMEGTLAHELAEVALRGRFGLTGPKSEKGWADGLRADPLYAPEMEDNITPYVDYVSGVFEEAKQKPSGAIPLLEQTLDFSEWVTEGFGIADALILSDDTIHIVDLKYGQGVTVYAENNPQLMLYGLGALAKFDLCYNIETVKFTIVQPRQSRIDTFEFSAPKLYEWGRNTVKPAANLAWAGRGAAKCGPWCKFCRVKAVCGTLAAANLDLAKDEFKEPELLSDERLAEIYKQIPLLTDWAAAVSERLLQRAIEGLEVPGYKVVEGRTTRKWADEEAAKARLEGLFNREDFIVEKLIGIPAAEKLLKKDFAPTLGDLVFTPQGAPTLVPESDKRPAMFGVGAAKKDFEQPLKN